MEQKEDTNIQDSEIEEIIGKEAFDRIKEMKHGEGLLTAKGQSYQSVIQRIATAITDPDKEYRQALLLASFLSTREADLACAAIAECQRYKAPITPIIDRIIARCGVKGATGGRVQDIIEAMTHQHITANPFGLRARFNKASSQPGTLGEK